MSGNLQYGYTNLNSAKQETGNTWTGVTGSYQVEWHRDKHCLHVCTSLLTTLSMWTPRAGCSRCATWRTAPGSAWPTPASNPAPLVAPVDTKEVAAAKVQMIMRSSLIVY